MAGATASFPALNSVVPSLLQYNDLEVCQIPEPGPGEVQNMQVMISETPAARYAAKESQPRRKHARSGGCQSGTSWSY